MERTRTQRTVPVALIVIAALLLAARVGAQFVGRQATDQVQWTAIDDAVPIAQATGKPLLFYFGGDGNAASQKLEVEVFRDEALAQRIGERFIAVRVPKEGREVDLLRRTFHVTAVPTIVFSDATGAPLARMEGFRGSEEFRRVMEGVR
jgi:thioredoxin-related protein